MFRRNHIAAVIESAAMVFSMIPLGAMAAEPTVTEVNVQLEAGNSEAGEYTNAGERGEYYSASERTFSSTASDTESGSDAGSRLKESGAEDAYGVAAAGSDEGTAGGVTGAGSDTAGAGSDTGAAGGGASNSGAAGGGASNGEAAGGGATNSGAAGGGASNDGAAGGGASNGGVAGGGASNGGTAGGGASNGGSAGGTGGTGEAGSTAEDIGGTNAAASEVAADQAADTAAGTEAAVAEETSLISIHGIVGREFVQYGEIDSEDLAGQYFGREVLEADEERGQESGAGLKGIDKVIYDALRKAVEEIAAGLRDTGVVRIQIPAGVSGLKSRYTAADLGLEYVYSGSLNPDLMAALEKAAPVHYDEIMDCLIADSACEMFPLTGGVEKPEGYTLPFYASGSGDDLDIFWDDYLEIALKPAEEFADPDSGRYAIDTTRIKVARGTAGAAKKIVKSAAHIANKSGFIPTTK